MPRFRDLLSYCRKTGWEEYRCHADHYYFRKVRNDGSVLLTKVSHALSKEIPGHLFQEILRHQLKTTKEEFNKNC